MGGLASHASRRRARASLQEVRHPAGGSTLTMGGLGGGGRGRVTRHLLRWRWGGIRIATPCASAQLQHPRRAGPPSRRPIWPKRAAVSRLFAQNVKRDLARLENREIPGVLERGAGLITASANANRVDHRMERFTASFVAPIGQRSARICYLDAEPEQTSEYA
jgi:hypothetical protein